jgi:hypothetical protein
MPSPSYVPLLANGRPITPSTVTASGAVNAGTVVTAGGKLLGADFQPSDHGFESWTHDPYAAASSVIAVNGRAYACKLMTRRAFTLSSLWWSIATAGVTPTAGQNEVGIYDPSGTRLASANVDADISSSGTKETALAAALTAPFVWAAFLFNAATAPTMVRGSSFEGTPSVNLGATARRAAVIASGLTALPASFDPATLTTTNCLTFWAGLEAA